MLIAKAYRLKLYPSRDAEQFFMRSSGACRWLWNYLLQLNVERYKADGTFVFRNEMTKLLPRLKIDNPWLADATATSLQRVCRDLDLALRKNFRSNAKRAGFPRFKNRFGKRSFYVTNQELRIEASKARLPKIGQIKFRSGRLPEGKILGANISLQGESWYCTVQCELEIGDAVAPSLDAVVVGVDLGLKELMVTSDHQRIFIPKAEKRKVRQMRLMKKSVSRKLIGSANREKARRRLAAAEGRLADIRRDCRHKATRSLVDRATTIVVEDLNVRGMSKSLRLGKSVGRAGMGEMRRQIAYKAQWQGKALVVADRFFPSTQTCSNCGNIKTGADKLALFNRTYTCDCGHHMDRDLNAAMNLRRYGLDFLGLENEQTLGQAMPRAPVWPETACGDSSAGPVASAIGRYGSMKQEPFAADSQAGS